MGTKGFASPEQYRGVCTTRGDVYSLGKTIDLLIRAVRKETVGLLDRKFFHEIESLCERASAEDPAQRFGDAGEMLAAFEKCCYTRRRVKTSLAGGIAALLVMVLAVFGQGVLRDAFRTNAAETARSNLTDASSLLCEAISKWESDPEEAHREARKADVYIHSTKHLINNLEPDEYEAIAETYYSLHHLAMIVSGSTCGSVTEQTDIFRDCVSDDIEYEEYLKNSGNMEKLFSLYGDDATLCRIIGDTGSARRIYEKALSMPGISPCMRTELILSERDLREKEEQP